jgi:NAD(P)-dependent dehydrogenase (short-subunit alcohol dehydrogenase family)
MTRRRSAFKADTGIEVRKWDVASFDACAEAVGQIESDFGPVDILVNNAGITRDVMFHKMTLEQWSAVINTNLNSQFNMCRPVIEGMRARGFGRIINISSINAQKGQMGQSNYCAAKAGEIGFTKALAQENANKGITVNAICPGYIGTEMVRAMPPEVVEKRILPQIPVRPAGRAGRGGALRRVPRLGGCRLHHRLDAERQRRPVHGLTGGLCWRAGGRRAGVICAPSARRNRRGRRCP